MRIAVDAMGGDHAPREIVRGAVEASRDWPELEIVLLGDEAAVRRELAANRAEPSERLRIVHSTQTIEMAAPWMLSTNGQRIPPNSHTM